MPVLKIIKRNVDAAGPSTQDLFLWDPDLKGFGLKVTPAGAKTYVYQYRMGGRSTPPRRFTIGKHGSPFTPTSAREFAEDLALTVARGIDPLEARRERQTVEVRLAFDAYVEFFTDNYLKQRWKSNWTDARMMLKKYATPVLKSKALPSITRTDINAVYDGAGEKVATRRNLHVVMKKLFRWAVSRGDLVSSPVEGIEAPPVPTARDRHLEPEELACAWVAATNLGPVFGPPLRLLIATGKRLNEIAGLGWHEVNQQEKMFTLPGGRTKNSIAHRIHLNSLDVAALDDAAKDQGAREQDGKVQWPKRGLVFTTTGDTPISGFGRARTRLDRRMIEAGRARAEERGENPEDVKFAPWVLHDLRRTMATGFQRLGVRLEVTEAVLGHISGSRSGIVGVYQRYDWDAEKVAALDLWANYIERLVASNGAAAENVVPIAAAR